MSQPTTPAYRPGINMALKTPPHAYEATVRFYRDIIGLEQLPDGFIGFWIMDPAGTVCLVAKES
ncbi:MAG: hypothetical protein SF028_13880 [Candidatus Sumerlaeia bacterium]|nr:hypothetical protein [Candidatus Sumerlaeia bacterium]